MLTPLLAHAGRPVAPHDLWGAWNLDPLLVVLLAGAVVAYHRGAGTGPVARLRRWLFVGAMTALVVALVSPLDAMAGALASAHMVQHVLLVLVAAPLLALSAPSSVLLRGTPLPVRRVVTTGRQHLRPLLRPLRVLGGPVVVWLLHVVVLWTWHAAATYQAALEVEALHVLEHATFLATGVLFWRVVLGARGGPSRVPGGLGVLLVFGMAMQGVFLSALLTFARTPWYPAYETTAQWGLSALADQQLAGVIMWIPGSVVYLGIALALLVGWLRESGREVAA